MRPAKRGAHPHNRRAYMQKQLSISLGHCSDKGRKEINQDFHGALIPSGPALALKGISVLITDGISSSKVSQVAAESTVKSFLTDYYSTSETWSVKTSAMRVIRAANSWMFSETQRSIHANNMDHGYVCTLSALVLKSRMAHIFHVGDSRIYRVEGDGLEPLTTDHRTVVSSAQSYLARAIGMAATVDIDYRTLPTREGDIFVLATDGVFEHIAPRTLTGIIRAAENGLDAAAQRIVAQALENGSPDNLTLQIVRIDSLPTGEASEVVQDIAALPVAPLLEAGQVFEGYKVVRTLHANHRSHVYLVLDEETGMQLALKIPAQDLRADKAALARYILEDWIARRVSSPHLLKAVAPRTTPAYLYALTEYIEGQTLAQWMIDTPKCSLPAMRNIVEQIAVGLRALHRKEMLHQDLRPENIIIDTSGTVKIIDYGAVKVAGVQETARDPLRQDVQGALQYTAPEYFIGRAASQASDYFSLGVIAYQMLTGKLPYGATVARIQTEAQRAKLTYRPARNPDFEVPDWINAALEKAVHPDPEKRYAALSEFITDLSTPNARLRAKRKTPLLEQNPLLFWKSVSALLAAAVLVLLFLR